MNQSSRILLGSALVLLLIVAGTIAGVAYYRLTTCNFRSTDGEEHGYYIYPGTPIDSVLTTLQQDYRIGSSFSLRLCAKRRSFTHPKAGYYRFPSQFGSRLLVQRLQFGEQSPIRLTLTQRIRTREQLAGYLGNHLLTDSLSIKVRLDSVEYLQAYHLRPETAVCLFIPNTYEVYWTITADQLFARMYKEYLRFWNEQRTAQARALHLTPTEVMTIASIIESETNRNDEYPIIASIYLNRLRKGIPLQACPTVIYAIGDFSMRRVLKQHLEYDSPYNTYKYRGLPPGPIRLPRPSVIDAVLTAPQTNYLYMCANADFSGTHIFSSTYAQHAAAARRYQQQLNHRHIR